MMEMLPHQKQGIVMYTTYGCASCKAAGRFMEQHGIAFEAINLSRQPELSSALVAATGLRMVPQIFFNGQFIGGYNELVSGIQSGVIG